MTGVETGLIERTDVQLLVDVVGQLYGWVTELDPEPAAFPLPVYLTLGDGEPERLTQLLEGRNE